MENLNDIEQIWRAGASPKLPNARELVKTIRQYRLRQLIKTSVLLVFTLLLAATMIWVVMSYKSKMMVTRIGEAGIFLGIIILLFSSSRSLKRISTSRNLSNKEFLEHLKEDQAKLIRFYNRTQKIGFIISSIGLLLYLYEGVYEQIWVLYVAYVVAISWILLCWFVVRPRAFNRKSKTINATIEKIESISNQLDISK